jgi:hypothetical protein
MTKVQRWVLLAGVALFVGVACKPGASPTLSDEQLWGVEDGQFGTEQTRQTRTYRRVGMADDRPPSQAGAANAWSTISRRRLTAECGTCL